MKTRRKLISPINKDKIGWSTLEPNPKHIPEPDIKIAISTAPAAQKRQGDQQNNVINK